MTKKEEWRWWQMLVQEASTALSKNQPLCREAEALLCWFDRHGVPVTDDWGDGPVPARASPYDMMPELEKFGLPRRRRYSMVTLEGDAIGEFKSVEDAISTLTKRARLH